MGGNKSKGKGLIVLAITAVICIPLVTGAVLYKDAIIEKVEQLSGRRGNVQVSRTSSDRDSNNNVNRNTNENNVTNQNTQDNTINNSVNNTTNENTINGTGNGTGTGSGNGNGTGNGTGTGSGTGNGTGVGSGTGTGNAPTPDGGVITGDGNGNGGHYIEYGSNTVELEESLIIRQIIDERAGASTDYIDEDDDEEEEEGKSNIKYNDSWTLSVKDNDYSKIKFKLNLVNAPYNNSSYCDSKLDQGFVVKLTQKPEGSTCTNYPETVDLSEAGKLNTKKHVYTKNGSIDFSNTVFSTLGDYYFSVYKDGGSEELYQVIVTLRGITDDNGFPTGKSYSMIQIKLADSEEKVNSMNYNVVNPNTYITIDKKKNVNSFWEKIFVDVYIAGYDDDVFDVLDANAYDDVVNSHSGLISTEIGNHYIARDGSGYIVPQTYIMTDDGKMYIGRKDLTSVSSIIQLAAVDDVNIGSDSVEQVDEYEVPVGTMYRVDFSANKQYREEYIQYVIGDFREAQENPEDNMIILYCSSIRSCYMCSSTWNSYN